MELKQYLKVVQKKIWLIAIVVIVASCLSGIKSFFFTTPVYEADSKLIVNQQTNIEGLTQPSIGTVQLNIMLINSYKEIIKTNAIMSKVAEQYPELGETPKEMAQKLTVTSVEDSQIMNLSYRDQSYEKAVKTVNAISNVFKEQIPSIMKIDNVTILNEAVMEEAAAPINYNPIMNILISFIVSLIGSIVLVFFMDYLDNTIKTERDLEETVGLPVLASISKIDKPKHGHSSSTNQKVEEGKYATVNH